MRKKITATALGVTLLLLTAGAERARAITYDIHFRPYCATADCGHANRAAYEDFVCQAVEEMNVEYRRAGISFRPTIAPNQAGAPSGGVSGLPNDQNQYSELNVARACKDEDASDVALAAAWRQAVASANSDEITYLLREPWATNCAAFPWNGAPYGIIGDANSGRGIRGAGTVFAHETGHYLGLLHTFTEQDPATHNPPNWDGDVGSASQGLVYVIDTPDDPKTIEGCPMYCGGNTAADRCSENSDCTGATTCDRVCEATHDEDVSGNPAEGHVWITVAPNLNSADPGSPNPDSCTLTFIQRVNGQTIGTTPAVTEPQNAMSYYGRVCRGPIVAGGATIEPFSDGQIARIDDARQVHASRSLTTLPDVCSGIGDFDHDGICDDVDSCIDVSNLCDQDTDADGDGIPDGCDNCPADANTDQFDLDGDGDGDACDTDDDDDGCFDEPGLFPQDQHPEDSMWKIGTFVFGPYCTGGLDPTRLGFEGGGIDTDGDGVPDCADYDDDDDGLCDDAESLSWGPGVPPGGCTGPDPCRLIPGGSDLACMELVDCPKTTWWDVCAMGGCMELFARFTSLINPNPEGQLQLGHIEILNQTLYALPASGLTASQSAATIGTLAGIQAPGALIGMDGPASTSAVGATTRDRVLVEIWRRTDAGHDELLRTVGEFDATSLHLGEVSRGRVLRISTEINEETGAETLVVDTTYAIGVETEAELPDHDGDEHPDLVDNCPARSNPDQRDDDGDSFGNRCDPDLNNDGEVSEVDVAHVRSCEGADLSVRIPVLCDTEGSSDEFLPDPVAVALSQHCPAADLSGDGYVDERDSHLASSQVGALMPWGGDRGPALPEPPPAPGCVQPTKLEGAKVVVRGLHRKPGSQTLTIKGNLVLPEDEDPAARSILGRGLRTVVRTVAGRTVLDVAIPPQELAAARATRPETYKSPKRTHPKVKVTVHRDRRNPPELHFKMVAKKTALAVTAADLPLSVELTFDTLSAATQRCARASFVADDRPGCVTAGKGASVVCADCRGFSCRP